MANIVLSNLRQMWGFAILREWTDIDPTYRISKKNFGGISVERDRVLSDAEIVELSRKIVDAKLHPITECAIWILLSTTCRIGELVRTQWRNIDIDARVLFIPKAIRKGSKNYPAKDHCVHLSDFTLDQLNRLREMTGHTNWLFPNQSTRLAETTSPTQRNQTTQQHSEQNDVGNHLDEKTITKQITDRQRTIRLSGRSKCTGTLILANGRWHPHDLRRTGATQMNALGVDERTTEKCLSHVDSNKVRRIYNRHGYDQEMVEAWNKLGAHLQTLLSEG
jgi:integrase